LAARPERPTLESCAYAGRLAGSPGRLVASDRWGETLIRMDGEPLPPSDAEYAGTVAMELTDEERRALVANGNAFVVPH
jgi:hypothetical protein